jgi:hypothetical protein
MSLQIDGWVLVFLVLALVALAGNAVVAKFGPTGISFKAKPKERDSPDLPPTDEDERAELRLHGREDGSSKPE